MSTLLVYGMMMVLQVIFKTQGDLRPPVPAAMPQHSISLT